MKNYAGKLKNLVSSGRFSRLLSVRNIVIGSICVGIAAASLFYIYVIRDSKKSNGSDAATSSSESSQQRDGVVDISPDEIARANRSEANRGKVLSYTTNSDITIQVDKGPQLALKISDKTTYKHGPDYLDGNAEDISVGKTAQVTYDPTTNEAKIIWYGL